MAFQAAALAVMAVFYGGYIFKNISQRKKNIATDQLGVGKTGFIKGIEITLKTATLLIVVIQAASVILDTSPFPVSVRIVGLILSICGTVVFLMSMINMKDNWRAGVPESAETELVTSGIYKFSRNPAFLGFDTLYTGIVLMFFNWALFIFTVVTVIIFHLQIVNVEEDFLAEKFGDDYLSYKKKVGRYIGRKSA